MAHPRHELNDAFLTPVRLSVMAALPKEIDLDFASLRDVIEADDSVLSKAISHLEKLGYVRVKKGYVGNRPRTWISSSAKGRRAFSAHVQALRAITADST